MHDGCGIAGADVVLGIPPMECHHQVCPSSCAFCHNPTSVTRSVRCVGNGGEMRRKDLAMAPASRSTLRGSQNLGPRGAASSSDEQKVARAHCQNFGMTSGLQDVHHRVSNQHWFQHSSSAHVVPQKQTILKTMSNLSTACNEAICWVRSQHAHLHIASS